MKNNTTSSLFLLAYCILFFLILGLGYRLFISGLSYLTTGDWVVTKAELIRICNLGSITGFIEWVGIFIFKLLDKNNPQKSPPSDSDGD